MKWKQEIDSRSLEIIEAYIRPPVRDEVEHALHQRFSFLAPGPMITAIKDEASTYQLHFSFTLPSTLFTYHKIEAEDGRAEVVIRDAISKEVITTGPLSSMKVEIVVLDSGFGRDRKENWTKEEFDTCVVQPRDNKGHLLKGNLEIKLINGVGYLDNVAFTDNSSWTRERKFMLGARVKLCRNVEKRVREARSEAFSVKDQRVAANQKDRPPSFDDEVCRLKYIGKGGPYYEKLNEKGIKTVLQFLMTWASNPEKLRKILGNRMSNKKLEEIIRHACGSRMLNKRLEKKVHAMICDYENSKLKTFDPHAPPFQPLNNPSTDQELPDLVDAPIQQPSRNQYHCQQLDEHQAYKNPSMTLAELQANQIPGSSDGWQIPNSLVVNQAQMNLKQLTNHDDLHEGPSHLNEYFDNSFPMIQDEHPLLHHSYMALRNDYISLAGEAVAASDKENNSNSTSSADVSAFFASDPGDKSM